MAEILDHRVNSNGTVSYLVDWAPYDESTYKINDIKKSKFKNLIKEIVPKKEDNSIGTTFWHPSWVNEIDDEGSENISFDSSLV